MITSHMLKVTNSDYIKNIFLNFNITTIRDVIIMSLRSWKSPFRGHLIITPSLDVPASFSWNGQKRSQWRWQRGEGMAMLWHITNVNVKLLNVNSGILRYDRYFIVRLQKEQHFFVKSSQVLVKFSSVQICFIVYPYIKMTYNGPTYTVIVTMLKQA